jgi:hypothetical protein
VAFVFAPVLAFYNCKNIFLFRAAGRGGVDFYTTNSADTVPEQTKSVVVPTSSRECTNAIMSPAEKPTDMVADPVVEFCPSEDKTIVADGIGLYTSFEELRK